MRNLSYHLLCALLVFSLAACSPTDKGTKPTPGKPVEKDPEPTEKQPTPPAAPLVLTSKDQVINAIDKLGGSAKADFFAGDEAGTDVKLNLTKVTDAFLKNLALLPDITSLDLTHTKITDEGVKH